MSKADGIHVLSRRSNAKNYKDAVSIVTLGTNIGASANAYPYFMHSFIDYYPIDSGIYYKNNAWHVYASGTHSINETDNWIDKEVTGIKAGDTVEICSRLSGNDFLTEVKKNGRVKASLTAKLKPGVATSLKTYGSTAVREMNIAAHGLINGEVAFFSWSTFNQSTFTNVSNQSIKVTESNSKLLAPYYDVPEYSHNGVGKGQGVPSTSNGYVVDTGWCRCNNQ